MFLYGNEKVIAGIVLYNPELQRLEENICALLKQVDEIVLMDNHSVNEDEIRLELEPVEVAPKGTHVSFAVPGKIRPSDKLFKIVKQEDVQA